MAKVLTSGTAPASDCRPRLLWGRRAYGHGHHAKPGAGEARSKRQSTPNTCRSRSCRWTSISTTRCSALRRTIRSQIGSIDVLVNNAGIERTGAIQHLTIDDFKATMETNYFGALRTIRQGCRHAAAAEWVHYQRDLGRRSCWSPLAATGFEVRARSAQRGTRARGHTVQCACRHRRTRDNRHGDGATNRTRRGGRGISAGQTFGHMFEASLDRPTPPSERPRKSATSSKAALSSCAIPSVPTRKRFSPGVPHSTIRNGPRGARCPMRPGYERVAKDFGLDAGAKRGTVKLAFPAAVPGVA